MQITQNIQNQYSQNLSIKYKIEQIDDTYGNRILTGAISNNLKYIIAGGSNGLLNIWNYKTWVLMKSISFGTRLTSCKFSENSKFLYVGMHKIIYQFHVNSNFKKLCKLNIHSLQIKNIFCMTNAILTSSQDKYMVKTNVILKQQQFKIQINSFYIYGLDYSMKLNLIASASHDKSIKLWNANDGALIIEKLSKLNQDKPIQQVQLVVNKDQLISLDICKNFIIWNINYKTKQLELLQFIQNSGFHISLILQLQFIIASDDDFFKVYTVNGEFVAQFEQQVDNQGVFQVQKNLHNFNNQENNYIQPDPTNILLVKGREKLYVLKLEIDSIQQI